VADSHEVVRFGLGHCWQAEGDIDLTARLTGL
jgi:hypothetical protein